MVAAAVSLLQKFFLQMKLPDILMRTSLPREGWNPETVYADPRHYYGYLGWYYFKLECNRRSCRLSYFFVNGVYLAQTTETSVSVTTAADGVYTVRGVGHYGSISAE